MKVNLQKLSLIMGPAIGVLLLACGGSDSTLALTPTPEAPGTLSTLGVPAAQATVAPVASASGTNITGEVFIRLEDPLDEPEYYCVDVPGAGRGVQLQAALQAHTCKEVEVAEDELFTINHPSHGQLFMKAYDLCLAADSPLADSLLHLENCSDSPLQRFSFAPSGLIQVEGGEDAALCLAVAPGPGTPTGGLSHLRLDLILQNCDDADPARLRWITR
ncbi:MAG: hypothetical protein BZY88_00610 [SAR202 cluster bacterium Io17-Chloro-G9]|nr:MAG: hypothetical protein BZY88_00610 [SAR202 cluster bacterium Io17-Chloro-G9]